MDQLAATATASMAGTMTRLTGSYADEAEMLFEWRTSVST